jgi:hypothetical protein
MIVLLIMFVALVWGFIKLSEEINEEWLRTHLRHKEIGWQEIGEKFTRYQLVKTRWFNVYLHQLYAPNWHPECHDHPWGFIAVLLRHGYLERVGDKDYRRRVGSVLFRPATFTHNVITPYGESWSIIFTTAKSRDWGFKPCTRHVINSGTTSETLPYHEYVKKYGGK